MARRSLLYVSSMLSLTIISSKYCLYWRSMRVLSSNVLRKSFSCSNSNHNKLAPCGTLHNWRFYQAQSHVTQKPGQISKIRPDQFQVLCPSLGIHGQLPAPIVNGGDSCWKWQDFQLSRARYVNLGLGHTAYRCASLINLYLHARFHWNFLWTADGHYRPTFIRSTQEIDVTSGQKGFLMKGRIAGGGLFHRGGAM